MTISINMSHPSRRTTFSATTAMALISGAAAAGPLTVPSTFNAGTPAVAAEVNGNFAAVADAVNDNDARVVQLEAENTELNDRILELESFISELRDVVSIEDDNLGNPAVVFSGVNVHVNNGEGASNTINGLGNLIVGYDERNTGGQPVCSNGAFDNEVDCLSAGAVFSDSHKTGSHTLIIGPNNNYSQYVGLVVGEQSTVNGTLSTALGFRNQAGGSGSTVTGGSINVAVGDSSSIAGGQNNLTTGVSSSVGGGRGNMATGNYSSVNGGQANLASGDSASISGGFENSATGDVSSVSGGQNNVASGLFASVSGGNQNSATGAASSVRGGQFNVASGALSTVGGGSNREAANTRGWTAGNLQESN